MYHKLLIEKLSFICLRGETVWVSFGGNYVDLEKKSIREQKVYT